MASGRPALYAGNGYGGDVRNGAGYIPQYDDRRYGYPPPPQQPYSQGPQDYDDDEPPPMRPPAPGAFSPPRQTPPGSQGYGIDQDRPPSRQSRQDYYRQGTPPVQQPMQRQYDPRFANQRPVTPDRYRYAQEPMQEMEDMGYRRSYASHHDDYPPDGRWEEQEAAERYGEGRDERFSAFSAPTYFTEEYGYWEPKQGMKLTPLHLFVFTYLLILAFSVVQVIMGSVFLYRCPVDDFIPEWNIIMGIVSFTFIFLIGVLHAIQLCRYRHGAPVVDAGERGQTAASIVHFHKIAWLALTIIQIIGWISGTCVISDRRPEFDLNRFDNFYDYDAYEDYFNRRRGQSRFWDAEIMNPDYCDPGIWVFTLVAIITGWVYLSIMLLVWAYLFVVKMEVNIKKLKTTEEVFLEKQKSLNEGYDM